MPDSLLKIEFCGIKGEDWASSRIDHIQIRNNVTKSVIRHVPLDQSSLDVNGFYKDVFSVSGKWLVLPRGRFDGFIIASSDTFKHPNSLSYKTIKLTTEGVSLAHFFGGWSDSDNFTFWVGLNEYYNIYECNAKTMLIRRVGPINVDEVKIEVADRESGEFQVIE